MDEGPSAFSIGRLVTFLDSAFPFRLLGFGLMYAWGICLWNTSIISTSDPSTTYETTIWIASAALTPLAFVVCAVLGRKRELSDFAFLYIAGPAAACLGTVLVAASPMLDGVLHSVAVALASLGTGIGPVIILILWACLLSDIETGLVEIVVPASFVATLICALLIPNLQGEVAIAVVASLPLLSGILLYFSKRSSQRGKIPPAEATETTEEREGLGRLAGNIARIFIVLLVSNALVCLSAVFSELQNASDESLLVSVTIGMLFAIALSVAVVLFSRRINIDSLYRWITVPLVFSLILATFDNEASQMVFEVLSNAVSTGLGIIMVLYFIRLAQRTGKTITMLMSIGECASYAGVFVGYMLVSPIQHAFSVGAFDEKTLALVLIGLFIATTLLIPRHDESWTQPKPAFRETSPAPVDGDSAESASAEGSERHGRDATAQDRFAEQCLAIAQQHGLSARETEVFLYLAAGRSQPYIRDALVLSKNTVATHVRHIYQKLNVHSRQELLDMVQ